MGEEDTDEEEESDSGLELGRKLVARIKRCYDKGIPYSKVPLRGGATITDVWKYYEAFKRGFMSMGHFSGYIAARKSYKEMFSAEPGMFEILGFPLESARVEDSDDSVRVKIVREEGIDYKIIDVPGDFREHLESCLSAAKVVMPQFEVCEAGDYIAIFPEREDPKLRGFMHAYAMILQREVQKGMHAPEPAKPEPARNQGNI